jgi:hypothetical protein
VKFFVWSPKELSDMFSNDRPVGKYLDEPSMFPAEEFGGCMKPLEYFSNDIRMNLEVWSKSSLSNMVYYKTKKNYYRISINPTHSGLVDIICHNKDLKKTISTWANTSSITDLGKEWLVGKRDLYVPLMPV